MVVLFPDTSAPGTGKGFFLQALDNELRRLGVEIIYDRSQPHDLSLENIRIKNKVRSPVVVRFDGVYHDTGINWQAKNASLQYAAQIAQLIVCQSNFGRQMVLAYLGACPDKIRVINNGSDPDVAVELPEKTHEHNFLTVAVWRPHKRLKETIEAFLLADIPDSILRICGKFGKGMDDSLLSYASDRVVFMDQVTDRPKLLGYMRTATALIHLCWFDCCPNSVVEAINQKCPVITNNTGGTQELVGPSGGIVLPLDQPYDLRPVNLYSPPAINIDKVATAMRQVAERRPEIKGDHIHIKKIAAQYKAVFEEAIA